MAENDKEMRAILVMQAEILGRLETLEQALASSGDPMMDRMASIVGLADGKTYDDPPSRGLA